MASGDHVVKWGIIGSGHIANAFCLSLFRVNSPRHRLVAVASRTSRDRAAAFAAKFKMPKAYGTYEEVFADGEINAIYVANLTSDHLEPTLAAIEAGKAVLVEKPMAMTPDDCRKIIEASRRRGVLCVEAVWSRFMPPFHRVRQVLTEGNKPVSLIANFVVPFQHVDRLMKPELGGGVLRDIGMYAVQLATMLWGGEAPCEVVASGFANEYGADIADSVCLKYKNGGLACILVDGRGGARTLTEAKIFFAPGSEYTCLRICPPFYVSTRIELTRADGTVKTEDYPIFADLPPPPEGLAFHNPASQALAYEAEAFADIFQQWMATKGQSNPVVEHPLRRHAETIIDAEIIAQATGQWLKD